MLATSQMNIKGVDVCKEIECLAHSKISVVTIRVIVNIIHSFR